MKKKYRLVDFIGRKVKIVNSPCKNLIGLEGEIIDEEKFYFIIERKVERKGKIIKKIAKIMKKNTMFEINGELINGSDILSTPEER